MNKFKLFFQKLIPFIKKRGLRGVVEKILVKLHLKKEQFPLIEAYHFIVDEQKVPFDEKEFETHKEDATILLNWVIPEMGKGSGGHINIFRFISNLENLGFHSRLYLHLASNFRDNKSLEDFLRENFAILDERVEVFWDVKYAEFAHATIATSWQTAYFVKNFDNTISKFYFVQDYEPYFYPLGSEAQFAKATYTFGFRGITAGDWLKDKLAQEFGMKTDSFGFSYDKELYKPYKKKSAAKRVFFYARPVTPRRDFEMGILALDLLCQKMPEVEVVFAGWDVSEFKIPFKHQSLGIVSIDQLSKVYSQCDLCFVLSNTNLSLLPLEVMASNSVAVCSTGANSTWLVNKENSVLVDYDPHHIAETLEYYLKHEDELETIRRKGLEFARSTSWEAEAEKVKDAILKGIAEDKNERH